MPRKAGSTTVPKDETKEQKFVRLAVPRTNRAIKAIRSVGKLSGAQYDYTPEQANKLLEVLAGEIRKCQTALSRSGGNGVPEFTAEDLGV